MARTSRLNWHRAVQARIARSKVSKSAAAASNYRSPRFEILENRLLLANDFGDAPAPYPTLLAGNGGVSPCDRSEAWLIPRHRRKRNSVRAGHWRRHESGRGSQRRRRRDVWSDPRWPTWSDRDASTSRTRRTAHCSMPGSTSIATLAGAGPKSTFLTTWPSPTATICSPLTFRPGPRMDRLSPDSD